METTQNRPAKSRMELRAMAEELLKNGTPAEEVRQILLTEGIEPSGAEAMIASLTQGYQYYAKREKIFDDQEAPKQILKGSLFFIGGIAVIIIMYIVTDGRATTLWAWIAMLIGIIQIIRGVVTLYKK